MFNMSDENNKVIDEQALENRCPSCGASISFDPKTGKWKCDYCGSSFTLEEMKTHKDNASTDEKNDDNKNTDDYNEYVSYKCESCGAEIVADSNTAATFCVYCGNTAILKSKLQGKFRPDKIIPFATTIEDAKEAFKSLSKRRPLTPRDFSNLKNIEKIKGVYIPFWLYDIYTNGDIIADATRVRSWTVRDVRYTQTDFFEVTLGGNMSFSNVPQDASTRFDDDIMNTIEPFDYSGIKPYNHAYLSGFYAEKYDVIKEDGLKEANKRVIQSAKEKLRSNITGYSSVMIKNDTLNAVVDKSEYAMLPVWMVNVKYKDKMYTFAMNGQTGKFIGNIPLDVKRTIFFTIIIFIISFLICFLGSYVLYLLNINLIDIAPILIILFIIFFFIISLLMKNSKRSKEGRK